MRLFNRVGRGEVIILARVNYYARERVDNAREILVDYRALHVDVAEQYAVKRVVKHNVEPFKRAHRRYLGHTKTRTVVTEPNVALFLASDLVERFTHEPEILLRRVCSSKALRRSAIGNIIKKALTRRANYGDYIRALLRCGLRLGYILVGVSRRNDYIKIRTFLVAVLRQKIVALRNIPAYALYSRHRYRH